jgi:DNA-directed RNA polymerase specialized sigma24 family protein
MTSIETMTQPRRLPSTTDTSPRVAAIGDPNAALVERLRRRESGAAKALVVAFGDRVYRLAIRITRNSADAEEVVQDALWAAMNKIDTFRGASAFGSGVYRITANAACQKVRGGRPSATRWRGTISLRRSATRAGTWSRALTGRRS